MMKKSVKWYRFLPGWHVAVTRGTIGFLSHGRKAVYVLQISGKDPWKRPHIEYDYLGTPGSVLAGWMFFYVGKLVCDPEIERGKMI